MELEKLQDEALELSKGRRWSEALEAWERVRKIAPRNAELWFRIAEAELGLGNHDAATEALETHETLVRKSVRALSLRARILSESGRFADAKESWRAVLAAVPDNFQAWARLAEATIALGERTAGRSALTRAMQIKPEDTFVLRLQRKMARQDRWALKRALSDGEFELAVVPKAAKVSARPIADAATARVGKQASETGQGGRKYTVEQAFDLSERGNWREAAIAWSQLLRERASDETVCLQAWEALWRAGRTADAKDALHAGLLRASKSALDFDDFVERAAELSLEQPLLEGLFDFATSSNAPEAGIIQTARALRRLGASSRAIEALERARAGGNPFSRIAAELSKMLFEQRDMMGLVRRFSGLLQGGPPERINGAAATICYQFGIALLSSKRIADATPFIEKAWINRPVGLLALRARAALAVDSEDFAALREAVNTAFAQVAPQPWPWSEGIRLLMDAEQTERAEELLRRAFDALKDNVDQALQLAERTSQIELDEQLLACLSGVKATTARQLLHAARIALQRGDVDMASALLARIPDAERDAAEIHRLSDRLALASTVRALNPKPGEWRFEDAVLWRIGERIAEDQSYTNDDGPIVVVNSAMGAGGAERQISATVAGLARKLGRPDRLKLICTRLTEAPDRRLNLPPVIDAGVEVIDLSVAEPATSFLFHQRPELRGLLELLGADVTEDIARMYRAFVAMRPSVVHLWQDRTSVDGGIAAVMAGVPSIVMVARSTRPVSRRRFRSYLRGGYAALLGHPNVLLANNSFAGARDYENWLTLEANTLSVVHNGFDFTGMRQRATPSAVAALRQKYGLPEGTPVLGGVLRFAPVKRPLLWLDVASLAAEAIPDLKLLLLGEGPMAGVVREHAQRLGIMDRLVLPGFVDPAPHIPLMSAHLLTSSTEGLPNALLEAQAFGVPVVSTNVGGAKETAIDGVSGFILDDDSAPALAEKVIKAIQDNEWRKTACPTAEKMAVERFDMESMLEKTLSLYSAAHLKA